MSGVVVEADGDGTFRVGEKVMAHTNILGEFFIFYFLFSECFFLASKCISTIYTGEVWGGNAEYIYVHKNNVARVMWGDGAETLVEAGSLPLAGLTMMLAFEKIERHYQGREEGTEGKKILIHAGLKCCCIHACAFKTVHQYSEDQ